MDSIISCKKAENTSFIRIKIISRQLVAALLAIVLIITASCVTVFAVKDITAGFGIVITPYGIKINNITPQDSEAGTDSENKQIPTEIHNKYALKFTKDYKQTYFFANEHVVMANYEYEGTEIYFSQRILYTSEYIQDTHYEVKKFVYDDIEYMYFTSEGNNTLLWNLYGYSFSISSPKLSCDELRLLSADLIMIE